MALQLPPGIVGNQNFREGIMKISLSRPLAVICALIFLMLVIAITALYGNGSVPWREIIAVLNGSSQDETIRTIIIELRIPRVIAALLCGAALGVSGAILQSVLRNSLAAPDLLGISAGGSCAGLLVMIWFPVFIPYLGIAAFAGALIVVMLIFAAARSCRFSPLRLILAGVALGALFSTISTAMLVMAPERYSSVFNFLLGGFSGISAAELKLFAPGLLLALILPLFMGKKLDILALGDDCAATLGIRVPLTRLTALTLAALGAASSAGCAGMLSFAGLIAPHTVRLLGRSGTNRFVIPASAAGGAILVITGDFLGQIMAPEAVEIPAGVFLSGCGALFFVLLLTASGRDEL